MAYKATGLLLPATLRRWRSGRPARSGHALRSGNSTAFMGSLLPVQLTPAKPTNLSQSITPRGLGDTCRWEVGAGTGRGCGEARRAAISVAVHEFLHRKSPSGAASESARPPRDPRGRCRPAGAWVTGLLRGCYSAAGPTGLLAEGRRGDGRARTMPRSEPVGRGNGDAHTEAKAFAPASRGAHVPRPRRRHVPVHPQRSAERAGYAGRSGRRGRRPRPARARTLPGTHASGAPCFHAVFGALAEDTFRCTPSGPRNALDAPEGAGGGGATRGPRGRGRSPGPTRPMHRAFTRTPARK
jgi:hypothetical protein